MSWKEKINIVLPLLRNKYVITGLVFMVWIGFFDQNNLVDRFSLNSRISDLEKQRAHYQAQIEDNLHRMEELKGSHENLEKFAREQYLMKKPDEELFIIIEE
jgi:cell division protein DivIC